MIDNLTGGVDPHKVFNVVIPVAKDGKLPNGTTEIPFEFPLVAEQTAKLYETYHGVYVNVHYTIDVEIKRSFPSRDMEASTEFLVQIPPEASRKKIKPPVVVPFNISPDSLENVKGPSASKVRVFSFCSSSSYELNIVCFSLRFQSFLLRGISTVQFAILLALFREK